MTYTGFSSLSPAPSAWGLPADYARHDPTRDELRGAMDQLAAQADWADLDWSGLVEGLLRVGATDIPLGRLVEGHIDAVRILAQADRTPHPGARYGVWASRSAGTGVAAVDEGATLRLNGTIRFASGAGAIDRALVPVWLDTATHLLVDLDVADLPVDRSHWRTSAMTVSQTHTVPVNELAVASGDVVGAPNFYLGRPAFLPGGVGVAAVWTGGLTRLLGVTVAAFSGRTLSPTQSFRLGRARQRLIAALAVVRTAGRRLDELLAPGATGDEPAADGGRDTVAAVCTECRAVVAESAVAAIAEIRALAGPAALAFDDDLGHALDDLGLYVAQLNSDAEAGRLGAGLSSCEP